MHSLLFASAVCWQRLNCGGRTFRGERNEKQMDASSVVRSGCCAGTGAQCSRVQKANGALDRNCPDLVLRYSMDTTKLSFCQPFPSRSRFSTSSCSDRRFHLLSAYDKATPIENFNLRV
jgi:hypothetical protein